MTRRKPAWLATERIEELMSSVHGAELENIHGILLVKNGELVFEQYSDGYDRDTKHYLASVTKSIASVLVGIAMDHGFIEGIAQGGLDKPISELFPEYASVINVDPAKQDLLFKHILSMSAGLEWDEHTYPYDDPRNDGHKACHSEDSVRFVLEKPVITEPGTEFLYNSGLSILLSRLIIKRTGMQAAEFAEDYLFGPLGIEDYCWDAMSDGLTDTDGGLHLRPRDLAKIGHVLLNGGRWEGSQIVSQEWINESTRVHISTGLGPDYGYQWWRGKLLVNGQGIETFFASGHGGQKLFIFPTLDLVAAFTHKVFDNPGGDLRNTTLLTRYIIPAMMPPAPFQELIELDPKDLDRFVGEYETKPDQDVLTIFREGNQLYLRGDVDRLELIPDGENQFVGTVMDYVDFQIEFFEGRREEVNHLELHLGFRSTPYDRVT